MNVNDLNLPAPVKDKLIAAGLDTATAVLDAGEDGLQAIDGIGPKTASDVLEAAQAVQIAIASAGNGDTAHEYNAERENHVEAQPAASAPDGIGSTDPKQAMPADSPDPNALVTVRNISDAMLLVGERYLLPGQTRTVRRHLIRHIAPEKLEIR